MSDDALVSLLFPPFCQSAAIFPHLAIPTLAGYLGKLGISCATFDLNVRLNAWLGSLDGPYDVAIRHRLLEFKSIERGAGAQSPDAFCELIRDVSDAPMRLLEAELPGRILHHALKDRFGLQDALQLNGIRNRLAEKLWEEISIEHIARSVSEAIEVHETLLGRTFGDFLARSEILTLVERAARSPLVGVNVSFSMQMAAAIALARRIKSIAPRALLVLGGSQISLLHERDLKRLAGLPFVDAVCRYEGEIALHELHRAAQGEIALEDVPNIVFKNRTGELQTNSHIPSIPLNDLPLPAFNEEELPLYDSRSLPVNVTRGCYWGKCTFCDYVKLMAPGQSRYIGRSVKLVVDDIMALQSRFGTTDFKLITEALPPAWAARFSKEIRERGVRATFWSYLKNERNNIWTQNLLNLMSAAGFTKVTCGVESTSDRVLNVIDKGTTQEMIRDNFEGFAKAGIRAEFNLIPDYPTTTLAEAADGVRFVLENRDVIRRINPQMFDLSVQSAVAGSPEQFGVEVTSDLPDKTTHGLHSLGYRRTRGLSDDERALVSRAYRELMLEISRYHLISQSRAILQSASFTWDRARISMEPSCRFLRSPVNLAGETKDVIIVTCAKKGAEPVEICGGYSEVTALLAAASHERVTFVDLLRAYTNDVLATITSGAKGASVTSEGLQEIFRSACVELAIRLIESGTFRVHAAVGEARITAAMATLLDRSEAIPDNGGPADHCPELGSQQFNSGAIVSNFKTPLRNKCAVPDVV
jgi:hypothetical protein